MFLSAPPKRLLSLLLLLLTLLTLLLSTSWFGHCNFSVAKLLSRTWSASFSRDANRRCRHVLGRRGLAFIVTDAMRWSLSFVRRLCAFGHVLSSDGYAVKDPFTCGKRATLHNQYSTQSTVHGRSNLAMCGTPFIPFPHSTKRITSASQSVSQ